MSRAQETKETMERIRSQWTLMEVEELTMRQMRAAELCEGGWMLRIFGIGKSYEGMPGSRLIHPRSLFATVWLMTSALFLLYSAICSSFYVGFLWHATLCDFVPPTLYFDMFIDVFFLVEIFITFFMGDTIAGEYCDSMSTVASRYLRRGGFVFDLGTSIPVSFVEWTLLRHCEEMSTSGEEFNAGILRMMRVSKALRVLRLLRAFKIIAKLKRIMEFVNFMSTYLCIPFYVLRVLKILMLIAVLVHLCSCSWWLVKTESNLPHKLHEFLENEGLGVGTTDDLDSKYVHAFYFVNTVFCTIGFGDISGKNDAERLYCVLLFYLGVFVFGSLLVEVQDAVSQARIASREREKEVAEMVAHLRNRNVPNALVRRMAMWADCEIRAVQSFENGQRLLNRAPVYLKRQLLGALHHGVLSTVPIFKRMDSSHREDLLLELFAKMTPKVFSPYDPIAIDGFGQSCLYVIQSGTVILQQGNVLLATFHTGDSFDEDWLLLNEEELLLVENADADADAAAEARRKQEAPCSRVSRGRKCIRYVAGTPVSCICLAKEDFDRVVTTYDDSVRGYFDAERARILGEAMNIQPPSPRGSDCDAHTAPSAQAQAAEMRNVGNAAPGVDDCHERNQELTLQADFVSASTGGFESAKTFKGPSTEPPPL